jgi:hypothetical protein
MRSVFGVKNQELGVKGSMLTKIVVGADEYAASDEPLKLLMVLKGHLEGSLDRSECELTDNELLTLKSWLLLQAENMQPGKAVWIEESSDGQMYKLVAALGRTPAGEAIVWHPPLPWPFDFDNESHRVL